MSIEQSLQHIADALLKVAESNHALAEAQLKTDESYRASITAYAQATAAHTAAGDAELEAAAEKVEADAKPNGKAAVAQALADAKAEKEKAAPAKEPAEEGLLGEEEEPAKDLDWKADMLPVLQRVGKDKDALAGLLAEFDVGKGRKYATGNLLPPETFPALMAAANKLLAG